jgi:hypothetical protein
VGINLTDPNKAEEETASVNYGQVLTGLLSLAVGGHFVSKQFTFVTPFSRSLIAIVASLFEETYITKPKTSRPLNSEVYLVGKWFKGISPELAKALLDRSEAYKTLDKLPTTWGSLLQPALLAQVDADILRAAQEVHGDQQVSFLQEIVDAYRASNEGKNKLGNKYEAQAQKTWLDENPLMVIASEENLNRAQIEDAARYMPQPRPLPVQMQAIPVPYTEPELEEESILIPEEEVEAEEPKEENETVGEKRTIKFTM